MDLETKLKGVRFGKCERWILETAPRPDQEPKYINMEYDSVSGSPHYRRIVIKAIAKLKKLGLVEVHRKLFDPETDDPGSHYCDEGFSCVNHRFWANHIRLTQLGVDVWEQRINI
jgi:hypothetical protein